jgi:uncharacterized protein
MSDRQWTVGSTTVESEIVVRGEGHARSMPDRAIVRAVVEGEGASREDAYGEAAEIAKRVDDVVSNHAGAIDRARTAALVVHPRTRWRKGESVRTGWRASRASVLDVTDLAALGEVIAQLAAAGAAISGPEWQIDPGNAAYSEARRLAAADARHRADDYAAALGLEIAAVGWVAEPGLRRGHQDSVDTGFAMAAMAAGGSAADEEVIEVTPDELTIRAAVEVGFSLEP